MGEAIAAVAVGLPPTKADWRAKVRFLFTSLHLLVQAHPRALPLISTGVIRTPSGRRWMEALMRALLEAGFTAEGVAGVYHALGAYTLGLGYAGLLALDVPADAIVGELVGHWADYRAGRPGRIYRSHQRTLEGDQAPRRDLVKRHLYLVPNSLAVSRDCPHLCDFCYKESFFAGGASFYLQPLDDALAEIERLSGRHLYFLDDNRFGSPPFATALFAGLRGMGRVWQAAATVQVVLQPHLLEQAVAAGCRSLFIGFETLSDDIRGAA